MPEQIALILIVALSVALFGVILLIVSLHKEIKGMKTLLKQVEESNSDMDKQVKYLKSIVPKPDPVGDIRKDIEKLKERTAKVGESVDEYVKNVDKIVDRFTKVNISHGGRSIYFVVDKSRTIKSAFPHDPEMIGKNVDRFINHSKSKSRSLAVSEVPYLG